MTAQFNLISDVDKSESRRPQSVDLSSADPRRSTVALGIHHYCLIYLARCTRQSVVFPATYQKGLGSSVWLVYF